MTGSPERAAIWQPDAIIFTGLQASGKSTFYQQRFWQTHVRINLDMLKTRHRERLLLQACIEMIQPFVVDNTNLTAAERARYIGPARAAGFRIVGYYFEASVRSCIARNEQRSGRERIPIKGLLGAAKRLQPPTWREGFDELYTVTIGANRRFVVEPMSNSGTATI